MAKRTKKGDDLPPLSEDPLMNRLDEILSKLPRERTEQLMNEIEDEIEGEERDDEEAETERK